MFSIYSKAFCLLFIAISTSSANARPNAGRKFFGIIEGSMKECMEMHNKTLDQVMDMEDADESNDEDACFFGCVMVKEGLMLENGQLNRTTAEAKLNAIEDVTQKAAWNDFFDELGEDLVNANDACSGGEVAMNQLYFMKHMKESHEEEEALADDDDEEEVWGDDEEGWANDDDDDEEEE